MRYGDIVVTLDPSRDGRMRMRVSFELAARAHARLTGYYVGPTTGLVSETIATDSWPVGEGATVSAPAADTVENLRSEFESVLRERGISGAWVLGAGTADLSGLLHHARSADLVITGIWPVPPEYPEIDVEALVVESGRPILGLPPGRLPDRIGRNIVIAWDESRAASRAVHDALPFLHDARSVRVVSIGNGQRAVEAPRLLLAHLQRLGVAVTIDEDRRLYSETPADEILSRLQSPEADLLVAGAFGHSRLGERLLGGASRTFLHQMMIPVLVSH
jgi:nucleotide-binding universal stress UspA family protein